jgi:hypothetical protein
MPINVKLGSDETKRGSFDPIPAGWYRAVVSNISVEPIKKEDSKYKGEARFAIEFTITDDTEINPVDSEGKPQFAGRKAFGSIMLAPGTFGWGATDFLRAVGAVDIPVGEAAEISVPIPGEEFDYVGQELQIKMAAGKDEKSQAKLENRAPETRPNGYKPSVPEEDPTGPAIPATGRRRVLR